MTSQVSTFMQNDSDIQHLEKRSKNPTMWQSLFNSENIEKCAVDSLIAKKKMQKHRQDLKNIIMMQYGQSGWNELLALEVKYEKKEQSSYTRNKSKEIK